jgi:hypothetical protein
LTASLQDVRSLTVGGSGKIVVTFQPQPDPWTQEENSR